MQHVDYKPILPSLLEIWVHFWEVFDIR